ncbi:MAG: hypothetical protein AAFR27_08850, partial [Pseudomonadota bacterium]
MRAGQHQNLAQIGSTHIWKPHNLVHLGLQNIEVQAPRTRIYIEGLKKKRHQRRVIYMRQQSFARIGSARDVT